MDDNSGGESRTIIEIFEIIAAIVPTLIIISVIFTLNNPDFIESKASISELSYISSIISNTNTKIKIKIPEGSIIKIKDNTILLKLNKINLEKKYIGNKLKNIQTGNEVLIE